MKIKNENGVLKNKRKKNENGYFIPNSISYDYIGLEQLFFNSNLKIVLNFHFKYNYEVELLYML